MSKGRATVRTAKTREIFIATLTRACNVAEACRAAGISRNCAYVWRSEDADFAAAWEAAVEEAVDKLEREAWRRGVEGVEKPVTYQGQRNSANDVLTRFAQGDPSISQQDVEQANQTIADLPGIRNPPAASPISRRDLISNSAGAGDFNDMRLRCFLKRPGRCSASTITSETWSVSG